MPQHSHVQSHAAVPKNNLCDSRAHLVDGAISCGWTRPEAVCSQCRLCDRLASCSTAAKARYSVNLHAACHASIENTYQYTMPRWTVLTMSAVSTSAGIPQRMAPYLSDLRLIFKARHGSASSQRAARRSLAQHYFAHANTPLRPSVKFSAKFLIGAIRHEKLPNNAEQRNKNNYRR